jgi:hypothetical protein
MAPSYIAGVVSIIVALQPLLGLNFLPEQWTAAIIVVSGIVVAARQIINGRSTWFGSRP